MSIEEAKKLKLHRIRKELIEIETLALLSIIDDACIYVIKSEMNPVVALKDIQRLSYSLKKKILNSKEPKNE